MSTKAPTASKLRGHVSMHFDLFDAPTVEADFGAENFAPITGWWEQYSEDAQPSVVVANGRRSRRFAPEEAPDWVPRPPAGWNSSIVAMRDAARADA